MKPVVKNAADPEQVASAKDLAKREREDELADLAEILALAAGRRVMLRLLDKAGIFASPWDHSGALMGAKAAVQDYGHWLRKEISEARRDAFLQLLQEYEREQNNG